MKYAKLFLISCLIAFSQLVSSQTTTVTIYYTGAQSWGCCSVCGTDYMCIGTSGCGCCQTSQQTKTFVDPVPPGNMVVGMTITYYAADCSAPNVPSNINGCLVGNCYNQLGTNTCACGSCNAVWIYTAYPTGMVNYNYGGINTLYSNPPPGTEICPQRVEIKIDYAPGTPPSGVIPMPGPISGTNPVCPGGTYTYTIPPTPGATMWNWTVPPGAVINSGQGTTSISVTFGASTGNICVTATSCTSTSPTFCMPITFMAPPAIPTAVTATPSTITCGGISNLNATSVGNTIQWYLVPTGGTPIGTSLSGVNFPVSPSVTTTYYAESFSCVASAIRVPVTVTVSGGPAAPTPVTATPPTISCGGISNLNATSVGNTIYWYTVPTGGTLIGSSLSGINYPVSPAVTTTYYAETNVLNSGSVTFSYTGALQTWTVPVGVTSINVDVQGAQGAAGISTGGLGGRIQATYPVVGGQVLNLYVGGAGSVSVGGFNGGGTGSAGNGKGGGGASDIRIGGTALGNRVIVAGGGGGAGYNCGSTQEWGGNGGGTTGQGGFQCNTEGTYATGGTQVGGGTGVGPGVLGVGGNGANTYGGGGGGGYYGGGGAAYGGGGGGSSYSDLNATAVTNTQGYRLGNGQIIISWSALSCVSLTRTPVTVTVVTPAAPTAVTATPPNVCPGGVSNLNATTTGTNVNWYTVPTSGTPIGNSLSGVNFPVTPAVTTTYYAETNISNSGSQTFNYTGSIVNWTVPAGVTSINVTAKGAQGGQYGIGNPGGVGAIVTGTLAVTPSQVLSILVGQQPPPNLSVMPGGGGGSYVGLGASYFTATPLIVAGGGGGSYSGGAGQSGQLVNITTSGDGGGPIPGTNGNGAASTTCAGGGGGFYTSGGNDITYGTAGAGGAGFRQGGAGGVSTSGYQTGGFGGGATADYVGSCNTTAGSGGGYSGGSGQNSGAYITSGYAGGSYNSGTGQSNSVGNTGDGQVIISWASTSCTSSTRTPVTVTVGLPGAPTPVTATPPNICVSGTSNLNAISTGNTINWYTVPTGGVSIGSSLSGVNFAVTPAVTTTYYAEATTGGSLPGTQTFSYTGAVQTWTVPSGCTSVTVDVIGAEGGTNVGGSGTSIGGKGGRVQGTIAVTPGNTLNIYVGSKGGNSGVSSAGGYNGGGNGGNVTYCAGGGGASDIRLNGILLTNRIFVAAGGGGAGTNCWGNGDLGGDGGGLTGLPGCQCSSCVGGTPSYPGAGGTPTAGGLLGNDQGQGCTQSGSLGIGGNGACTYGGGGGGGYYGGGGAGYGGGGGGSSYADPTATAVFHTQGYQTGNGQVVLSWTGFAGCSSATRTAVTVTVSPATVGGAVTGGAAICLGNQTPLLTLSGQTGTVLNWEVSTNGGSTWTTIANTGTTYQTVITVGGTYWYRAVVQSGTCASQFSNYTVVTVPTMTVISPTTGTSGMCNIMSPNSWVYILDPVDKLIAGVFDATGGNDLMNTTAYLYIDPTVQIHPYSGEPYLQRHFQITPVSSGIANVKLYFTQAEFAALQVAVPTLTSINDLAITKFDDIGLWANAVYYGSPIATANDPWPGVHSLQITVTSFSKFYIHPKTLGTPLPVGLLSFTGKCEDSKATLNWSTSSELNNDYFSVEKTRNGEQWDLVATVKGSGNSNTVQNYSYVDENPLKGDFYYRISQTDFDGTTKLFEPIAITCASTAYEVNVFPNPFNEDLVVSYKNMTSDKADVKVIDVLGNVVSDTKYQLTATGNDSFIINLGNLAPGLYYFEFKAGDYNYRTRVVKN